MSEAPTEPEPVDLGHDPGVDPPLDETEDAREQAAERLEDAEAEFGPDAAPRGVTPGNPRAEEKPS